jgi:hypothetical protein
MNCTPICVLPAAVARGISSDGALPETFDQQAQLLQQQRWQPDLRTSSGVCRCGMQKDAHLLHVACAASILAAKHHIT